MSKTIQIRISEQEHKLIKIAFKGDNLSKVVRDYLLQEAENRMLNSDMSLPENDDSLSKFIEMLSNPAVQQTLFKVFKEVNRNE